MQDADPNDALSPADLLLSAIDAKGSLPHQLAQLEEAVIREATARSADFDEQLISAATHIAGRIMKAHRLDDVRVDLLTADLALVLAAQISIERVKATQP